MIHKEAWYREAAGFEAELRDLFNRFRRGIIDKEEYISRTQRILHGNPEKDNPTGLVQDGGMEPWGDPIEGLCLAPKFFEWREPYKEEYERILDRQSSGFAYSLRTFTDFVRFPQFCAERFGVEGEQMYNHLFVLMGGNPRSGVDGDTRAVVPQKDPSAVGFLAQAKTEEEFVTAFRKSWDLFLRATKEYGKYLEDYQNRQDQG